MNHLNLTDALKLYNVLRPHLPDYKEGDDPLEYFSIIIKSIKKSERYKDYTDALSIMTGMSSSEILKFESEEILQTFMNSLVENRIVNLREFAKRIEYNG
jgi:hypothetical protein